MKNSFKNLSTVVDNLSDIVDKQKEEQERQEREQEELRQRRDTSNERKVIRQFEAAKEIIGHRLTMKKQHSTMFYFNFKGIEHPHCAYICLSADFPKTKFDFTVYDETLRHCSEHHEALMSLKQEADLSDLKSRLIDWCKLIIKVCYSKEEN